MMPIEQFIELFFNIGVIHYFILALLLFMMGLLGVLISRNMLRTVMSLFLMTISVVTSFLTFGCYCDTSLEKPNMMCVFVLITAVVQTIIALVILYKIYRANEYLDVEKIKDKES